MHEHGSKYFKGKSLVIRIFLLTKTWLPYYIRSVLAHLVRPLTASCLWCSVYATPSMSLTLITYSTQFSWKLLPQAEKSWSLGLALLCGNSKEYFWFRPPFARSLEKSDRLVLADVKAFRHRPVSKAPGHNSSYK